MDKVFEALNYLYNDLRLMKCLDVVEEAKVKSAYKCLQQTLTELKAIKEAKSSEALKTLEILDQTISPLLESLLVEYEDDLSDKITANYFALKKALIKAQEQEKEVKALNILKEYFDIQIIETDSKEMATITISRKDNDDVLHFAQKLIKDKEKINLLKEVLK